MTHGYVARPVRTLILGGMSGMVFNNFDCPACKGIGERPATGTALTRRVVRCRRCRGTGLI